MGGRQGPRGPVCWRQPEPGLGWDGPEPNGRMDGRCTHAHIEQHVHVSSHVVNGLYVLCTRLVLRYNYRVQEWRK